MKIQTVRNRLARLLRREAEAWLAHRQQYPRGCFDACEERARWYGAREFLLEALRAAGARAPRWLAQIEQQVSELK
jgi:hypothetical protein